LGQLEPEPLTDQEYKPIYDISNPSNETKT